MAQADVLTLVDDLSLGQANATEAAIFYAEIIRELGFFELLTSTETIVQQADVNTYELATSTIMDMEYYNSTGFLTKADGKGLGSVFGSDWRNRKGSPIAISQDQEDESAFRLVPAPLNDDTITIIRTETRTDVPSWLELPIAFEILSREFQRESDHQDTELATTCKLTATLLFNLVGVTINAEKTK